jgi:phage terminase small subunit
MQKDKGLSIADEKFAAAIAKGSTATDAYRLSRPKSKATDKTMWEESSKMLKSPKLATRIAELKAKVIDKYEISVERVLKERARLAFFNAKNLLHSDGTPKAIHELDDDIAAAIAGIDVVNVGSDDQKVGQINKIKLADKNASLTALEKYLGMNKDVDLGNGVLNISINLGD